MMGSCRPGGVGFVALWLGKKAWVDSARGEVHTRLAPQIGEYAQRGVGWTGSCHTMGPRETVHLTGINATCCAG